jgi:hypothetical protein
VTLAVLRQWIHNGDGFAEDNSRWSRLFDNDVDVDPNLSEQRHTTTDQKKLHMNLN